ncbi:thiamine phosphate synthase [Altererythrobacter indicus]|uniref:Thiamine phosphate synthase n=1 Tax=Altericroceibacterium indicum TaxID=374177 RepID=A0A845ACS2_9SPHN|nr:thiamine phosphate synthase [Altericroceibacterium indicum]MXP26346.1 thiamine phosphate synthase [Altericroceibacterium indicum]
MHERQTKKCLNLARLWLISDARNDAGLDRVLRNLPHGSGFIYRHYHLPPPTRESRFRHLARIARRYGHSIILADTAQLARKWRADGVYGAPEHLGERRAGLLRLATVHSLHELGAAHRAGADAALLSPAFPTRSHPGGKVLGINRFHLLEQRAMMPVIALGGVTRHRARVLATGRRVNRWAAIDGLSSENVPAQTLA